MVARDAEGAREATSGKAGAVTRSSLGKPPAARPVSSTSDKVEPGLFPIGKAERYIPTQAACREAFERYVRPRISESPTGCWIVNLRPLPNGYTQATVGPAVKYLTHRLAYRAFIGPAHGGLHVLHRCDNPPCCNPAHLFLGTPLVNARDQKAKGRPPRGGSGKFLLPEQVRAIRRSTEKQAVLAQRYGCSYQTISLIKRGRIWKGIA